MKKSFHNVFIPILTFPVVSIAGTLQRPFAAIMVAQYLLNLVAKPRLGYVELAYFTFIFVNMMFSLLLNPQYSVLRSSANCFIGLIFFIVFMKEKPGNGKYLLIGMYVQFFTLIIDWFSFQYLGKAILAGVFSSPTKWFPSGLTGEPSDAAVLSIILQVLLFRKKNYYQFLIVTFIAIFYAAYFRVETYFFLLFMIVPSILVSMVPVRNKFKIFIIILFFVCLTYFQYILFDFTIFNDSAHNRITTPTYVIHAAINSGNYIWGNGFGSIGADFTNILTEGVDFFDTGYSSEQRSFLTFREAGNPSIFNFYARVIYEQGIFGLFFIFIMAVRYIRNKEQILYFSMACGLWFISDIQLNLLLVLL